MTLPPEIQSLIDKLQPLSQPVSFGIQNNLTGQHQQIIVGGTTRTLQIATALLAADMTNGSIDIAVISDEALADYLKVAKRLEDLDQKLYGDPGQPDNSGSPRNSSPILK